VARLIVDLRALGVAVSQEGGNPLTDAAACEAVLALFRLADHPGDRIARYHVASSPVGALLDYANWQSDGAASALSARIRRLLLEDGYGRTCTRLARDLAPLCDAREARRLGQLAQLAYRHDAGATLRPGDFVRIAETERVEDATTARVRVMTVHQAKGLEFDIVVLPELDTPVFGRGADAPVLPYRADPAGRTTAVYPATSKEIRRLFPELERAHQQARDRGFRDALSTLYVAVTRARHALHVLVAPDGENGPGTSLTLARIVREAIRSPDAPLPPATEGAVLLEAGDPGWFRHMPTDRKAPAPGVPASPGISVRVDASSGRRRAGRGPAPSRRDSPQVAPGEILRLDAGRAMRRGIVVHAFLERIRWLEEGVPPLAELRSLARAVAPEIPPDDVETLIADFHASLEAPEIRAILSRASYPAECIVETELPFLRRSGGGDVEGKIDRVVLGLEKGRFVSADVIDFKTDRVGRDRTRASRLAASYTSQLGSYLDAVSAIYRIPRDRCAATLVFLDGGHVLRIDPPDSTGPLLAAES
jgi:ATP-dependent helicase/nuclease subunit A